MNLEELVDAVREWGREHKINNPYTQYVKMIEEAGELAHELVRGNLHTLGMEDAVGDTFVTLIILADILEIDLKAALAEAYGVISKRKGSTVNGNFIKGE